ncbi:MAG: diadenylate cyclase [Bacteroidia bacterium]|nr:diadenylate cyclase [Bacteroidia bacterium]
MDLFDIGFVTIRLVDVMDILLVTFIFFKLYQSLKGRLAIRITSLIVGIFLIWKMVAVLDFRLLRSILDQFLGLGAVAVVIIFAPEIRRFLTNISKNTFLDRFIRPGQAQDTDEHTIKELVESLKSIRATGNGALIVLTGSESLREIEETGDELDANVSSRLIYTIFQKESPLHDGAMILRGNKISAVRAILPISKKANLDAELGLRHRSAIGVSEISDVLVIVSSEERREISLAYKGELQRAVDYQEVEEAIRKHRKLV